MGRLLRHAERRADLGPRCPVGARRLDVAVEQLVAEPAQLVRGGGRGAQAIEHAGRWVGLDRLGQLLECQASLNAVKVRLTGVGVKTALTRATARRLLSRASKRFGGRIADDPRERRTRGRALLHPVM